MNSYSYNRFTGFPSLYGAGRLKVRVVERPPRFCVQSHTLHISFNSLAWKTREIPTLSSIFGSNADDLSLPKGVSPRMEMGLDQAGVCLGTLRGRGGWVVRLSPLSNNAREACRAMRAGWDLVRFLNSSSLVAPSWSWKCEMNCAT